MRRLGEVTECGNLVRTAGWRYHKIPHQSRFTSTLTPTSPAPEPHADLEPEEPHQPLQREARDRADAVACSVQGSPASGRSAQPAARNGRQRHRCRPVLANEPSGNRRDRDLEAPLRMRQRRRPAAVGPERLADERAPSAQHEAPIGRQPVGPGAQVDPGEQPAGARAGEPAGLRRPPGGSRRGPRPPRARLVPENPARTAMPPLARSSEPRAIR